MNLVLFNKLIKIVFPRILVYDLVDDINGISSQTEDGYHIVFIDIDEMPLDEVIERIKKAQEFYELGDFHIFKSRKQQGKGYHIYCLDKLTFGKIIDIHRDFFPEESYIYDKFALKRGYWVLRTSEKRGFKPKYLTTIKSDFNNLWEKSKAHKKYLEINFDDFKIKETKMFDPYSNIGIHKYTTIKKKDKKTFLDVDVVEGKEKYGNRYSEISENQKNEEIDYLK